MQIANIRKGWRPLAALAAAVAMLGAVTISQPQTAQAAVTVTDADALVSAGANGGEIIVGGDLDGYSWGGRVVTTVRVSRDTTVQGNDHNLMGIQFVVTSGATLTVNDAVLDGARQTSSWWDPVEPYDVQSGTLNINGGAAISDNGNLGEADTIHVGNGATVNINTDSTKVFHSKNNTGENKTYSSIYGSDFAIRGDEGSTINIKSAAIADENNTDANGKGAIVSWGTVNFTGGRSQSVRLHGNGVLNLNGGTIDKALQDEYNTNTDGDDAALTMDDGTTAYLTKGVIKGSGDYALNLSAQAKVYAQAAGQQDLTVDGYALYIAKANGNNNGFVTDPTVSAGYSSIPNVISGQQLQVSYGDVSTLPKQVAADADTTVTKPALNTAVVNDTKISSSYLGYHGNLNVYGKYTLKSSTLNRGGGVVNVYGVPAQVDYEWYSKAEVQSNKQGNNAEGYAGRKFAGWYKSYNEWKNGTSTDNIDVNNDANYTTVESTNTTADGTVGQNKFAWAHFADAKNQNVGVQEVTYNGKRALRFISTLDSKKYDKVTFNLEFSYQGKTVTKSLSSPYSYSGIIASGKKVTPKELGIFGGFDAYALSNNNTDGFFVTVLLTGVPADFTNTSIKVTPSWTTLDGTVVTGQTVVKNI